MARFFKVVSLLSVVPASFAATPIPNVIPFTVTGGLDGCNVDNPSEYNSGGSISINNFQITVPKNLIVQFPVVWSPFSGLCGAGAGGYETTVVGNIIGDRAIAGQIQVAARFGLEGSQGYIEAINQADGTLKIRGGPTVRINDPEGIFGKASDNAPFFPADGGNPSVSSFSGFPMCIPRSDNDEKCPQSNRPTGTTFAAPDPLRMVPFRVGDFIEFSGLKVGGSEILAWSIVAVNVQVTTSASDTVPNYIRVEDMLVGVRDNSPNVEFADIKVIGFLSSCAGATVNIQAIEVDPCTGEENLRTIGSATPRQEARCKWEARLDSSTRTPYTREYRISTGSPVIETKDGIQAGQFIAAVGEWIFPEVDVPGTEPPPYPFGDIRGLVNGDYLDGKRYGPLNPFPGTTQPTATECSDPNPPTDPNATPTPQPEAPAPVAAVSQFSATQRVGAQILLAGSNTASGIPSGDLVFAWTKTAPASPAVTIQNAGQPTATVVLPAVNAETTFEFTLTVSRKSDPSKSSTAKATVKVSRTADDIVTLDTYTWESRQSGTISVTCHSNVLNGDNKGMSLVLNNGAVTRPMIGGGGAGKWSYNARSTNRPTNVQCVSDLKGKSAVVTATTSRRRRRGELGAEMEMSPAKWL